jgi:hypothetical protein
MSASKEITYTGRIVDNKKQAPILGAKVKFVYPGNAIISYTDIEGIFQLKINFSSKESIYGKLIVEANGYKTYYSSMKISPQPRDLGDIKLLEPHDIKLFNSDTDIFIPIPVIATILAGLFAIAIIAMQTSNSKFPVRQHKNSINIYQP